MLLTQSVRRLLLAAALPASLAACVRRGAAAPHSAPVAAAALREIVVDSLGVLRWRDDDSEVALFGANYTLPSASDFRAAGYLGLDRRKLIDDDIAHFARMGWTALRLSFWGDWENSDTAGNLVANAHLDLLDYLVARARERGIYMMLSPITTYEAGWPDSLRTPMHGLSFRFDRGELGTNPRAIAAQARYLTQLLDHVNPYTGIALGKDPAIPFVELVNEPWHHPDDVAGSVRYIDALADAVRNAGSRQIIVYNVSQDFRIATAIRRSRAQGVTFGWYPSGLNSGHELEGNYLRAVDDYPPMLDSSLAGLPRLVYEFDTADLRTGYMYPAMARTFRSVGAQFVTMFSYDMLGTASRNLGWQTHYLNLVATPQKAISAIIAAEAMRRLPRFRSYGPYPRNTTFGDFHVSYEQNLAELTARDAFMYTNDPTDDPHGSRDLQRIVGYGNSALVRYEGRGAYFLDKLRDGVWRLEVYPDAVPVRDPYETPRADKVVTRVIWRRWPIRIRLGDLGGEYYVQPLGEPKRRPDRAEGGRFVVAPGVYLLSREEPHDLDYLPKYVGHLRLDEFHAPPPDTIAPTVVAHAPWSSTNGVYAVRATVVDSVLPDTVYLSTRRSGGRWRMQTTMGRAGAYDYVGSATGTLGEGDVDYAITVVSKGVATTYPGGQRGRVWDWNYGGAHWTTTSVTPTTPLPLFVPRDDATQLAFSRIGDAGRAGLYRTPRSDETGEPLFHLELPRNGNWSPSDYTASLVVKDRIGSRRGDAPRARAVRVRLRAVDRHAVLHLALMEADGTSWSAAIQADSAWRDYTIPLSAFEPARGVLLPEGFPGEWNYWVAPAAGRGGAQDRVRVGDIERVQLSLRSADVASDGTASMGVEVASIVLTFAPVEGR